MNAIFIVSDTLRRDHLGCYGNKKIRTPNLDRLARKSIVFENTYTCSFPTVPHRADIFTGRWTFNYLGWAPLPKEDKTLSEHLLKAGYRTKAVVDTPVIKWPIYGYEKGFSDFEWIRGQDVYYYDRQELNRRRRYETDYCAPATMLAAERWLEGHYKEKFFLYVDTWDPHEPWNPPKYYTELYHSGYDGRIVNPCYDLWRQKGITEEDLKIAHAGYCGEITMMDRWVGHLLDGVEAMGLMEDTSIIFTTDHGFYFGEHGIFGKGISRKGGWYFSPLYEEITHIPLLIYVPGLKPTRNTAMVSSPDLMPTVLELAGVKMPTAIQGKSLISVLEGKDSKGHDCVVSSWPLYNPGEVTYAVDTLERQVVEPLSSTVTSNGWTLIYGMENWPAELYNLVSDPKQEKNLITEKRDIAQNLLDKFILKLQELGTSPNLLLRRQRF